MNFEDYMSGMRVKMKSDEFHVKKLNLPEDMTVTELRFKAGECVIYEGEPCTKVHILIQGKLRIVSDRFIYGSRYALSSFNEFYLLGEYEIFGGLDHYIAQVTTVTDSTFLIISKPAYMKWLHSSTETMFLRAQIVSKTLISDLNKERQSLFDSSDERLKRYLALSYEKHHPDHGAAVMIRETRMTISEEIGYCIRTVNRSVKRLELSGLIRVCKGKIRVSAAQYERLIDSFEQ